MPNAPRIPTRAPHRAVSKTASAPHRAASKTASAPQPAASRDPAPDRALDRTHDHPRGFRRDERPAISMAFVVMLPLLLAALVSSFGLFNALRTGTLTARVAYVINDIMSRHDAVDPVDMAYLAQLRRNMLPDTVTEQRMRITSICFAGGRYRVMWSDTDQEVGVEGYGAMTDRQIPHDIMPALAEQESVILTEMSAVWSPAIAGVGVTRRVLRSELVIRPRFVLMIPHATLNPSHICPLT